MIEETVKEIWADLLSIIDEHYHKPQVNTAISSPFMIGENFAYKIILIRMRKLLKEKYNIEVSEGELEEV